MPLGMRSSSNSVRKGSVVHRNNRESNIEQWDTLKVLMSDSVTTKDGTDIGISLVVNQPIFRDGNEGFPKASLVIMRGRSSYRIPFFKGSKEEPIEVLRLMTKALELWDESGSDEYEKFVQEHRAKLDSRRQRDSDLANEGRHNHKGVGGELSQFSKVSKRERRKWKKSGRSEERA